jgi:hypothetical protein
MLPPCTTDRHGCTFLVIGAVVVAAAQLLGGLLFFTGLRRRQYLLDVRGAVELR